MQYNNLLEMTKTIDTINFYLRNITCAIGIAKEKRDVIMKTKPEIEITVSGNKFTVKFTVGTKFGKKTIQNSIKLGEEYEIDSGDGKPRKVIICRVPFSYNMFCIIVKLIFYELVLINTCSKTYIFTKPQKTSFSVHNHTRGR